MAGAEVKDFAGLLREGFDYEDFVNFLDLDKFLDSCTKVHQVFFNFGEEMIRSD